MSKEKNIILYLPFDEGKGSKVAYDYSPNRSDGRVEGGADFGQGKVGNAIEFTGKGEVVIPKDVMNTYALNANWTIMAWIKPETIESGSPTMVIVNVAMKGVNKYIEERIALQTDQWSHIAVVKMGPVFKIYLNTILIKSIERAGTVTGFTIAQDYFGSDSAFGMVDDLKIFDAALTYEEITNQLTNVKTLEYYIDGINFKDFGVFVSDSKGLTDRPKMKTPYSESWSDYHGKMVDLNHKYVEERTITLSCFIKVTEGKGEFVSAVNKFMQIFDRKGTHRLMVDIHPTKPLVYEVYMEDAIEIKKTWNDGLMVGTFTLKLKEPNPVKRVLKFIKIDDATKPAEITINTNKMVDVFWGDGSADFDISGNVKITHAFDKPGDYYIIVAGCIDEIQSFDTNSIIVWPKI